MDTKTKIVGGIVVAVIILLLLFKSKSATGGTSMQTPGFYSVNSGVDSVAIASLQSQENLARIGATSEAYKANLEFELAGMALASQERMNAVSNETQRIVAEYNAQNAQSQVSAYLQAQQLQYQQALAQYQSYVNAINSQVQGQIHAQNNQGWFNVLGQGLGILQNIFGW